MSFAYEMGFRGPRCNGCSLAKFKYELGDKFLMIRGKGVYELDAEPRPGQGEPQSYEGRPIRFHWWGMSYQHSDECYHWQPPKGPPEASMTQLGPQEPPNSPVIYNRRQPDGSFRPLLGFWERNDASPAGE